ncbi:MAG: copper-binding protein [Rhodospirillaceae bacterium]|jgi:plastocyanin|nr:copper-binding protein [Rhodospirillaceae bacterium]
MWLRSSLLAATLSAIALPAIAGGEVEVTEERKKACAKAEARFEKMFPDYKAEPGVVIVKLYKYNFCPANLTVKPGTTVRWINVDRRTSHSVWMKEAGIAESERFFPEEVWQHTFTESGAYPYLCGPHWEQENMRGYVKVAQ